MVAPQSIGLTGLELTYGRTAGSVINNGHTIQVNLAEGNSVVVDAKSFSLLQFHFHLPSEHTVDRHASPMEMHLVHADAEGNLAVVGVLIAEGAANEGLAPVWAVLPAEAGAEAALAAPLDVATLLPADHSIYRYDGSLTTPPCSEGVEWLLMTNSVDVSAAEQVAAFAGIHSGNARPVQPVNDRTVLVDVD